MTLFNKPSPHCPHVRRDLVQAAAEAFVVRADGPPVPCTVQLAYHRTNPYAVQIRFPTPQGQPLAPTWTFARSLLEEGLRVPAGEGDIRLLPCAEGWTGLELHGAPRIVLVLLPTRSLRRFLAAAYAVVPAGAEHHLLDLDTALTGILSDTA